MGEDKSPFRCTASCKPALSFLPICMMRISDLSEVSEWLGSAFFCWHLNAAKITGKGVSGGDRSYDFSLLVGSIFRRGFEQRCLQPRPTGFGVFLFLQKMAIDDCGSIGSWVEMITTGLELRRLQISGVQCAPVGGAQSSLGPESFFCGQSNVAKLRCVYVVKSLRLPSF